MPIVKSTTELLDDAYRNKKSYVQENGAIDKYLVAHVKNHLFSCYDGTTIARLTPMERKKLNIDTFCFIVTEVYKLSPEQLDSIWAVDVLVKMNLSSLVRDIDAEAPDSIKEATLFDKKLVVLHECFPDYFACTYPPRYDVVNVIHATGPTLKTLCRAGRVNTGKVQAAIHSDNDNDKAITNNAGEIIDRITYGALNVFLKTALNTSDIYEHLQALSHPNTLKIKSLGVSKVIASRGCWASLLDFYYLNSSAAAQTMFFEEYRALRAETQDYDSISAFMDEIEL